MRFHVVWRKSHEPESAYRDFFETNDIDKAEQQIPVNNGVKHTVKFRQSQFEAGVILDPRKAERNDGNIPVSGFFQRFAQQRYVI